MRFVHIVVSCLAATAASGCSRRTRHTADRATAQHKPFAVSFAAIEVVQRNVTGRSFAASQGRLYWVDREGSLRRRDAGGAEIEILSAAEPGYRPSLIMEAYGDHVAWTMLLEGHFLYSNGRTVELKPDYPSIVLMTSHALYRSYGGGLFIDPLARGTPTRTVEIGEFGGNLCMTDDWVIVSEKSADPPTLIKITLQGPPQRSETRLSGPGIGWVIGCTEDQVIGLLDEPAAWLAWASVQTGKVTPIAPLPTGDGLRLEGLLVGDSAFVIIGQNAYVASDDRLHFQSLVQYPLRSGVRPRLIAAWFGCVADVHPDGHYLYWMDPCSATISRVLVPEQQQADRRGSKCSGSEGTPRAHGALLRARGAARTEAQRTGRT